MSSATTYISQLDFEDSFWASYLRNLILEEDQISEDDIEVCVKNFLTKVNLPCTANVRVTAAISKTPEVLYKISNNENVRGILDNRDLTFSPFITVIYGKNGSGKSTFYKILKDAFNSPQNILGNIYQQRDIIPKANIEFTNKIKASYLQKGGREYDLSKNLKYEWERGKQFSNNIKFCDSEILTKSLKRKETGWSIDRFKLNLFDKFQEVILKIENQIDKENAQRKILFELKYETFLKGFKENPDDYSPFKPLSENSIFQKRDLLKSFLGTKAQQDFEKQKSILYKAANLNSEDYIIKIKNLTTSKDLLVQLQSFLKDRERVISGIDKINEIILKINQLKSLRNTSDLAEYNLLFNSLEPTSQELYFKLIRDIANLALNLKINDFPDNIDKCFYCNQDIPSENKLIIKKIHELVSNESEKELEALHQSLDLTYSFIKKNLEKNTFNASNLSLLFSIEIYDIETKNFIHIDNLLENTLTDSSFNNINKCIINLSEIAKNEHPLDDLNLTINIIRSQITLVENELTILTEDLSKLELVKIANQKKLNVILDEEYKIKSRDELKNLLELIDSIESYSNELAKFKTTKLKVSNKKKQAENELINDEYLHKFKNHLDSFNLQKREKISRVSRIEAGKSIIESNIGGHKLEGILSEGEAKVHAICDWFAELEVSDSEIAIFDDPINSLDQGNIRILAKNIFNLTKTHQIIVFTHNLEFYNNLVELINGKGNIAKSGCFICKDLPDSEKCTGFIKTQNALFKCSSFYQLKHFTSPGFLEPGIPFNSLHFIDRFNKIKQDLENSNDSTVDKELRSAINDFVEKHVFADIKKFIFNNNDLITFNKEKLGTIEDVDFERLKVLHGEISAGSGTLHSTEEEITNTLDPRDYIKIYDEVATIINKATGKPNLSLINN